MSAGLPTAAPGRLGVRVGVATGAPGSWLRPRPARDGGVGAAERDGGRRDRRLGVLLAAAAGKERQQDERQQRDRQASRRNEHHRRWMIPRNSATVPAGSTDIYGLI